MDYSRNVTEMRLAPGQVIIESTAKLTKTSIVNEGVGTARQPKDALYTIPEASERFETWDDFLASSPPVKAAVTPGDSMTLCLFREREFYPVPLDPEDDPADVSVVHDDIKSWWAMCYQLNGVQRGREMDALGAAFERPIAYAVAGAIAIFAVVGGLFAVSYFYG